MLTYYMMDKEGNITETNDVVEWSQYFEKADRIIAKDIINEMTVSTVFLGLAHYSNSFNDDKEMNCLFETMIFGDENKIKEIVDKCGDQVNSIFGIFLGLNEYQVRYQTLEEAREGHKKTVELVKKVFSIQG